VTTMAGVKTSASSGDCGRTADVGASLSFSSSNSFSNSFSSVTSVPLLFPMSVAMSVSVTLPPPVEGEPVVAFQYESGDGDGVMSYAPPSSSIYS